MGELIMAVIASVFNISSNKDPVNISAYTVKDINSRDVQLSDYKGKVLLIVNVASKCGFTPQYKQLQEIYDKYRQQGFVVLGFPSNDFAGQEPGSNAEIAEFCSLNYGVTFPMFGKVKVSGKEKEPLFDMLTDNKNTGYAPVKWNFEKFIIGKDGFVVKRFGSSVKPDNDKILSVLEQELGK